MAKVKYTADLFIGKRFGRLVPLYETDKLRGFRTYHCLCDCGNEKDVAGTNLIHGKIKSCGCLKTQLLLERNSISLGKPKGKKILLGQTYGSLTVTEDAGFKFIGVDKRRSYQWKCKCDCGNFVIRSTSTLKGIGDLNCGCKRAKLRKNTNSSLIKFRTYRCKAAHRSLAFELSEEEFISIINSDCFYCGKSVAMGIDRIDNSLGYTKENSVACCSYCNYAKRERSLDSFISWFTSLYRHWYEQH